MAHKILVMSPLHNMGSTVASMMLAQGMTFANKTSMLLFTRHDSNLPDYLGIDDAFDPTRSVMQIVRLIDSGAIDDSDILDYTYHYATNAHLLNTADKSLNDNDRMQVLRHVYTRATTDIVIVDNSEDIETRTTQNLVEESDMIFLVVQPNRKAFQRMKLWVQHPTLKDKDNIYIIVDNYNEVVYSVRDLAKFIGFPSSRVCKLHYNPWITKCCMNGQLQTVLPLAKVADPRVANLRNDIEELQQCVAGSVYQLSKKGYM